MLIAIAPICGFFFITFLNIDFYTAIQLLSYIGIVLLLIFRNNSSPIIFPKYLLFYLLFVLYVYYSTFIQLDRDFKSKYLLSRLIGGFGFMFIVENVPISKKFFRNLIKISVLVLILAIIVIIVQEIIDSTFFVYSNFRRLNVLLDENSNNNRLVSIYSWIGEFSEVGFSFVPIFILVVEYLDKKKKSLLIWIFLGLIFAFLSKARWIMVNTLFVFVLLAIRYKRSRMQFFKYLVLFPFVLGVLFLSLEVVGIDTKGIVNDRILENDKKSMNERSAGTRLLAFKAFGILFSENPVFGVGNIKYGMGGVGKQDYKLRRILRGRSSQIHVGYLSLLYMYGLIGGFLFLSFLFLLLKKLYKNAKITGMWSPFLGFLGLAIANLTMVYFSIYQMGFIIIMVASNFFIQNMDDKNRLMSV